MRGQPARNIFEVTGFILQSRLNPAAFFGTFALFSFIIAGWIEANGRPSPMARLTQQQLETHLWGAARILRGRTAGQDYKTYILSLMFFKRLSDQWVFEADE
jgi:hypothetical protein